VPQPIETTASRTLQRIVSKRPSNRGRVEIDADWVESARLYGFYHAVNHAAMGCRDEHPQHRSTIRTFEFLEDLRRGHRLFDRERNDVGGLVTNSAVEFGRSHEW